MHSEIVGKDVEVEVGSTGRKKASMRILEQIGNGFLAQTESGKFCSVHYDICGALSTTKLYRRESKARDEAEKTKGRMS